MLHHLLLSCSVPFPGTKRGHRGGTVVTGCSIAVLLLRFGRWSSVLSLSLPTTAAAASPPLQTPTAAPPQKKVSGEISAVPKPGPPSQRGKTLYSLALPSNFWHISGLVWYLPPRLLPRLNNSQLRQPFLSARNRQCPRTPQHGDAAFVPPPAQFWDCVRRWGVVGNRVPRLHGEPQVGQGGRRGRAGGGGRQDGASHFLRPPAAFAGAGG